MANYHYYGYNAKHAIKSAIRECTEAQDYADKPHMYETALWHVNAALRKLTLAQFKLMQANSKYKAERGLD